MRGTILHFTTELGRRTVGGVGTCLNELRRASGPGVGFVLLGERDDDPPMPNVVQAGYYDMDVLNRLDFDAAVFHHYGLAYLVDDSFLRGRPLVYVVHSVPTTEPWSLLDPYGGHDDVARAFERLLDAASRIVCLSRAERGKLLTLYPDLHSKTFLLPAGFSALEAMPLALRPERSVFGFLGRADERKGIRELVRAFADAPGARLRIACGDEDPDYAAAVRDDIARLGLEGRIEWVGRVGEADKLSFLRSLDALVAPSRWEPFGYVALEALRAGVPPLVGRQGGLVEIVGSSYPYVFDPTRVESIAGCIAAFRRDDAADVRRAFAAARRRTASWTAERMAAAFEAFLREPPLAPPASAAPARRYAGNGELRAPAAFAHASATPRRGPFR
ncbi:glycosyltransferase family 4 protein [Paenibacillus sp.]|uniref:glycosyltransferase family 4 protein n=1 Tax=Paenibacillus sp. TaxID=58172 RepID=UPI002D53D2F3|nr:glycosyltransferase family 4 protein [Paenibacillus sp.]HZG56142.1 glycosyltransferase family 4 protein [Paenibacillus sp.]